MAGEALDANAAQRRYWNTVAGPRWVATPGFRERRNQESLALLLAHLGLTEDDFAWATKSICAVAAQACGGRVVSALEGGYDLAALSRSAAAHVRALMEA